MKMTNEEMQDEIDRLLGVVEEQDAELARLEDKVEKLNEAIDTHVSDLDVMEFRAENAEAQLEEPPEGIRAASMKILRNIGEVLPEGEDVVSESVGLFNLRRGLEDLWNAFDSKGKQRHPWVRGSEGSM